MKHLIPCGDKVPLYKLPKGSLFAHGDDCIAMKSEYMSENGLIEAYILGSGEIFWGDAKTVEEHRYIMVQPLDIVEVGEDTAPVVRCKDCMRRGTTDCPMLEAFNSYPFHEPEGDAFCSYGVACHTMKTVSQMMNEPKIKTHFARIVVCGTEQNPYYNILYYDPSDKEYHLGYGSYYISFVRQWLAEEFEITPGMNEPVVHGRWEYHGGDDDLGLYGFCSNCQANWDEEAMEKFRYCPLCGAKMYGEKGEGE